LFLGVYESSYASPEKPWYLTQKKNRAQEAQQQAQADENKENWHNNGVEEMLS
jgi:hypothetical protein